MFVITDRFTGIEIATFFYRVEADAYLAGINAESDLFEQYEMRWEA